MSAFFASSKFKTISKVVTTYSLVIPKHPFFYKIKRPQHINLCCGFFVLYFIESSLPLVI